jgi:hypothetical protein
MFIRTRLPQLFLGTLLGLLQASVGACRELVLEFLDAARRVNELQLARVKRMAGAANVDLQLIANTASFERIATAATNGCLLVLGMNVSLHESSLMDLPGDGNCRPGWICLSNVPVELAFGSQHSLGKAVGKRQVIASVTRDKGGQESIVQSTRRAAGGN